MVGRLKRGGDEDSAIVATIELLTLDATVGREKDTMSEVAKALTVAQLHGGVEARVICKNFQQMVDAHELLSGSVATSIGAKWDKSADLYELPNGSAISVMFEVPSCR